VQRGALVRGVERLATAASLDVDRVAGLDEGGDVGDRVVHRVSIAVALDVQGLVQVHRIRRVDGDELDVGAVELGQARVLRRLQGRGDHLGRELRRDLQLTPDLLQ
jgi:hypothetical protein